MLKVVSHCYAIKIVKEVNRGYFMYLVACHYIYTVNIVEESLTEIIICMWLYITIYYAINIIVEG